MKNKTCLPCSEVKYHEFPDLLFGKSNDDMIYFNPGLFIKNKGDIRKHSILEFERAYYFWLKAVSMCYSINMDDLVIKDESTGNILMEESLALLFVSYVDPTFAIHMIEKISELLMCGIALSDAFVVMHIKEKFTKEELLALIDPL